MAKGSKKWMAFAAVALMAVWLAGCGNDKEKAGNEPAEPIVSTEPITLVFASHLAESPENFDIRWGNDIREKFPHITVEYVERGEGRNLPDFVTAGNIPDIFWGNVAYMLDTIHPLGLGYDLTDQIRKFNYDMDRFDDFGRNTIQNAAPDGIYGLTLNTYSPYVMFYNIDLFDKFGVEYPKDGMTYDEVYDLARRMTRTDGGVDYRGTAFFYGSMLRDNQLGVPFIDPKEDRIGDMNKWIAIFNDMKRFYEIPGNNRDTSTRAQNPEQLAFHTNMNIAMSMNQYNRWNDFPDVLNWDMVSIPTMKENPGKSAFPVPAYWFIMSTSPHKDQAFQVITHLLSDELQAKAAREIGRIPSVKNPEVRQELGKEVPKLQGKNMQAVFYHQPADYPPYREPGTVSPSPSTVNNFFNDAFFEVIAQGVDVNTALRTVDEKIQQAIAAEKAK